MQLTFDKSAKKVYNKVRYKMIDLEKKIFQICNDAYQEGRQILVEGNTRKILYERFTTSEVTELNGVTVRVSKWSNWSKVKDDYLHKAYHCRPISIDEILCDKTTKEVTK